MQYDTQFAMSMDSKTAQKYTVEGLYFLQDEIKVFLVSPILVVLLSVDTFRTRRKYNHSTNNLLF